MTLLGCRLSIFQAGKPWLQGHVEVSFDGLLERKLNIYRRWLFSLEFIGIFGGLYGAWRGNSR